MIDQASEEEAPLCSECGRPMEQTTAQNAQLLHGGVPFDCQSNEDCSQYAPQGVASVSAVDLSEIVRLHTPNGQSTMTLCCDQCGQDTTFIPENLDDSSPVTCSACGTEEGTWGAMKQKMLQQIVDKHSETILSKVADSLKGIEFK